MERQPMTESQVMARLRHEILTVLFKIYPRVLTHPQLVAEVQLPFLTRDKQWLQDAVKEQIQVLQQASLLRPSQGGYTLTDRGRMDRQQAARFLTKKIDPPNDAA
jgi:hypothetical protein